MLLFVVVTMNGFGTIARVIDELTYCLRFFSGNMMFIFTINNLSIQSLKIFLYSAFVKSIYSEKKHVDPVHVQTGKIKTKIL